MDLNFQKQQKEEREKRNCLSRISSGVCRLAINWLEEKIKEHGGNIKDKERFEESLYEYIERSWVTSGGKAVLSSAATLFDATPKKAKSLRRIFSDHRVNIGEYMFSITITPSEVLVADGLGSTRRRVDYDSENQKFIYGVPIYQKGSEL